MKKLPISAFIIAKNEADRIAVAIRSVRDWVDEVHVIDSDSSDDTVTRSRELGAQTHNRAWTGFGPQKVYGESLCRNPWVLNLDADEEVSLPLRDEIIALFEHGEPPQPAYWLRRTETYNFHDQPHPWAPASRWIRLYRKDCAGFKDSPVHDTVVVHRGKAGRLRGRFWHRSFRSFRHHVDKVNAYSSAQAEDRFRKGRNPSWLALLLTPPLAFLKCFILRREFVNGIDGVLISYMYAFQRFIRLAKTRERFQRARRQNEKQAGTLLPAFPALPPSLAVGMNTAAKTVLWWGRFDPDYSRNRILRQAYAALGWQIADFRPLLSPLADIEALLRRPARADLVHVPCFRQRDIAAAARYARRHRIPLLIDPLISAYDKQVFERAKFHEASAAAKRLLRGERRLLQNADVVLADTPEHARFFADTLGVTRAKLQVVYVGAEESLFAPAPARAPGSPIEVLFYGSFIALQGAEFIVEAARAYRGPAVRWVLLGNGPLLERCKQSARGLTNVVFEPWLPYAQLPARIRRADILLGVFGATPKAQRVIPNKVFQALACGRPLVTCRAPAYPAELAEGAEHGIAWVPVGDGAALATAVAELARHPERLGALGQAARAGYEKFFSGDAIRRQLQAALAVLPFTPARG